jgi:hypothetical protein
MTKLIKSINSRRWHVNKSGKDDINNQTGNIYSNQTHHLSIFHYFFEFVIVLLPFLFIQEYYILWYKVLFRNETNIIFENQNKVKLTNKILWLQTLDVVVCLRPEWKVCLNVVLCTFILYPKWIKQISSI